jgi:esterase/lipase superfamily enzyme
MQGDRQEASAQRFAWGWRWLPWAACVGLACATSACRRPAPPLPAKAASAHLVAHQRLEERYQQALASGPTAALAFAAAEVDGTKRLGRDDPARADALEMMAQADLAAEHWKEGLPLAADVVRVRRVAQPPDDELLALALGLNATLLFANDRSEESDAMLAESLDAWRRAFGPKDIRTAEKVEMQAELVQKGFGRTDWVVDLLREAADIREANPASSRAKLAETLTELAIHEMNAAEYTECDAHVTRAHALLQAQVARSPGDEEAKALLVQSLVLRSGLAAKLAKNGEALRLAREAEHVTFADRSTQIEMQLIVWEAVSTEYALTDQIDAAIAEEQRIVQTIRQNIDLFDPASKPHALDIGLLGDVLLSLGNLYLEKNDLTSARSSFVAAQQQLGDTSGVLFALADLARKSGDEATALTRYRAALKLRKESASEVTVLFGTSRAPLPGPEPGRFGTKAGDRLRLGSAAVLVPGAQFSTTAWLERPSAPPLPVGRATDAAKLLIRSKRELDDAPFRARAVTLMKAARLNRDAVLIFVHGFNVTFDQALQRGAQLKRDLNFDGPVAVFSWPSQGSMFEYGTDRVSADAAVQRLTEFVDRIVTETGARRVHIVAHSMGNRVLLPSLMKIAGDPTSVSKPRLGEIILAAPAVPEREFASWLDVIVTHGVNRITLYASAIDVAMWAGFVRERTALAGFSSRRIPLTHAGMESIDITKGASGELFDLNHDVFASNPVMSEDIRRLLIGGPRLSPEERLRPLVVKRERADAAPYWVYEPAPVRGK